MVAIDRVLLGCAMGSIEIAIQALLARNEPANEGASVLRGTEMCPGGLSKYIRRCQCDEVVQVGSILVLDITKQTINSSRFLRIEPSQLNSIASVFMVHEALRTLRAGLPEKRVAQFMHDKAFEELVGRHSAQEGLCRYHVCQGDRVTETDRFGLGVVRAQAPMHHRRAVVADQQFDGRGLVPVACVQYRTGTFHHRADLERQRFVI